MAEFVALDCRIELDGVVLSDHCKSLAFNVKRDMPEATSFSNLYKRYLPGLKDLETSLKFNADYAAASVDATLFPAWDNGTAITTNFRPTSGAKAADNPDYETTQYVEAFSILNVTPGAIASNDVTFKNAVGSVTRDITP